MCRTLEIEYFGEGRGGAGFVEKGREGFVVLGPFEELFRDYVEGWDGKFCRGNRTQRLL